MSYFHPSQGGKKYLPPPRRWWHGMKESQLPKIVTPQQLPAKVREDTFYRRLIPRILP